MKVTINGVESDFKTDSLDKFTELVELIKSSIDPEHIITDLILDGHELSEEDWASPMSLLTSSELEVSTGTPSEFVHTRFSLAAPVIRDCYMRFRSARKDFQCGKMQSGNQRLLDAVNILQAFFSWYSSIIELIGEEERKTYDIEEQVHDIAEICKKICQYQLYQSWWALGETIKEELEPKLDDLEDFCRTFEN